MQNSGLLITGATGTIGRALLAELGRRNVRGRLIVRDPSAHAALAAKGFELAEGDLREPASLPRAMEGMDRLFLLTPVHRDAEAWVSSALDAARKAGIRHVVRLSALGAAPDAGPELLRQHARCDEALKQSGLRWTILKPGGFFQNLLWQAGPIRSESRFYLPLAAARLNYVDARDVGAAAAEALIAAGHEGADFELTGPESLTCAEMAGTLSTILGREVAYVAIPPAAAEESLLSMGLPEWDAREITRLQAWMADGQSRALSDGFQRLTGRTPRSFEAFARDHAGAFGAA